MLEIPLFEYGLAQWLAEPDAAFDAFLTSYRFNQRRLRASSFVVYKGMFVRLRQWTQQQGLTLLDINEESIENFLLGRKLSAETRHRYLLLFTSLFEHLAQTRAGESQQTPLAGDNPARVLLLEKEAPLREDPAYLNANEVQRFLASLPAGNDWKCLRDRALAHLLLGAGLRSSEVLALRASDLERKAGELNGVWVAAHKPRPARHVPIQAWALPGIEAWVQEREAMSNGLAPGLRVKDQRLAGLLLFPSNLAGAQFKPVKLFRLVQTALQQAGILKRYEGPSLLRNSCGAAWLQRHEPLQVSLWLGHAAVRTTELLLPSDRRTTQASGKPSRR